MSDLKDKLIRIERSIQINDNKNDSVTFVEMTDISIDDLRMIVTPEEDDPLLYGGYELSSPQLQALVPHLKEKIEPNFKLFSYFLICEGIYDWDKI